MVRNKYNFLNSFWMKTDTDCVGYCRIQIWNRIEKINANRIRMYPLYYHIKFEYGYGYPYWCLNRYEYRIIRISGIRFPSLPLTTSQPAVLFSHNRLASATPKRTECHQATRSVCAVGRHIYLSGWVYIVVQCVNVRDELSNDSLNHPGSTPWWHVDMPTTLPASLPAGLLQSTVPPPASQLLLPECAACLSPHGIDRLPHGPRRGQDSRENFYSTRRWSATS